MDLRFGTIVTTAQGKQPLWKCGNKEGCDTGKGYPWASWNENEFDNALKRNLQLNKNQKLLK